MKNLWFSLLFFVFSVGLVYVNDFVKSVEKQKEKSLLKSMPTIMLTLTPTATPTKKVLSFEEANRLYGPCAKVFVLMYHHIQTAEKAKEGGYLSLTVTPDNFRKHLEYLKGKNYVIVPVSALSDFFERGISLSAKSVILTFDDGYADFYENALPLLKEFNFPATVFLPTGLVSGANYLNWGQISEAAASGVYFANHTWSHKSLSGDIDVLTKEITTADTQLNEKGLNSAKIFAYPYGKITEKAKEVLVNSGYKLAFSVNSGTFACAKKNLEIPRLRVGNNGLSNYGL